MLKPCPFCGGRLYKAIPDIERKFYDHPKNKCILERIIIWDDEIEEWNTRFYEKRLIDIGAYAENILTVKKELMNLKE